MTTDLNDGLLAPGEAAGAWEQGAWRIGAAVAAPAADDVDRQARFPVEAVDALRDEGFLGALLPKSVGGGEAGLLELVGAVRALAAHCASSALVLAMHSIEAFNLARHGTTEALTDLQREVAEGRLLIANANSEVGIGGDVGRSICALDRSTTPWTVEKQALAISYGEHADLIFATARAHADAVETDQVFMILRRGAFSLEAISGWDTLGLRGTCSKGYRITADVDPALIFPMPFATVAWVGLAEAAAARAHAFVRAAARKSIGTMPPSAMRLAEIAGELQEARSLLVAQTLRFDWLDAQSDLENAGYVMALRNLKVSTSTLAVQTATAALGICGIVGYRRDSEYSLDRVIRDSHGGLIMVSNDRQLGDNALLLLARRQV